MKALSLDLRERIVSAYEAGGVSFAKIGRRFSVSGKVVGTLVRQKRELGTLEPQVHRRGRKRAVSGDKEAQLREHLKEHLDATVLERRKALGFKCSEKTLWQTLRKLGWRFKKKSSRASEQDRAEVALKRKDWRTAQEKIDPERLVFLDETGLKTDLTRLRGWAEG